MIDELIGKTATDKNCPRCGVPMKVFDASVWLWPPCLGCGWSAVSEDSPGIAALNATRQPKER